MNPVEVVAAYFAANDHLDPDEVTSLYAEDGEMVVNGIPMRRGHEAIRGNYAGWMAAFRPGDIVSTHGPLIASEGRVAVEICTETGGARSMMSDFFEVENGKIVRLSCYVDTAGLNQAMAAGTRSAT